MPQDSLSALLDGECSSAELDRLLDELDRSPELGAQWSRLCLAREAGIGTRVAKQQPCICADVMGKLDAIPAVANAKVVDLAVHKANRRSRMASIWKPAIGFAAAASVGAAAVMFIQPQNSPAGGGRDLRVIPAGTVASWSQTPELRTVATTDDAHSQMLREYLMDHSNAIADEGVGGTLRYARFAAHTAEYRSQTDEQP
jgi:negative regulator of sigma E activity